MELIAVMLFVFIPGFIVGLPLGLWLFRGFGLSSKIFSSILLGLFFALVVAPLINGSYNKLKDDYRESQFKKEIEPERKYFSSALEGAFDETNIREHYKTANFTTYGLRELLAAGKINISQKSLPVLIELAQKNPEVQGLLAELKETPLVLKLKVAESAKPQAVLPMARSANTSQEVLLKLATNEDPYVADEAIRNGKAPPIIHYIKDIRACYTPRTFIENKKCTIGRKYKSEDDEKLVWAMLANDKREYVRFWVASNSLAPQNVLKRMASDESIKVRAWLMLNDNTPNNLKEHIKNDIAASPQKMLQAIKEDSSFTNIIAFKLVQQKDVMPGILNSLAEGSNFHINVAVAKNPNTPAQTLESLSKRQEIEIREAVINNPNTPLHVLKTISQEKSYPSPEGQLPSKAADMLLRRAQKQ